MGILLFNENKIEEMTKIMQIIHSNYVPTNEWKEDCTINGTEISIPKACVHPILFGGDQLTAARARGAKRAKGNSITASSRLDGLIPVAEDWHTRLNYMGVILSYNSTYRALMHGLYPYIFFSIVGDMEVLLFHNFPHRPWDSLPIEK